MFKKLGYNILELMLVLVIVGTILAVATRYYQSTSSAQKVNTAANMLQDVITACEDWKMTNNSYKDITTEKLIDQGLVKTDDADAKTKKIINPWGGNIDIQGNANNTVTFTLDKIPKKECLSLDDIMQQKNMNTATCDDKGYSATYPKTDNKS